MTTTTTNGTSQRVQELLDAIAGDLDRLASLACDLDERGRAMTIARLARAEGLVREAADEAERRVAR